MLDECAHVIVGLVQDDSLTNVSTSHVDPHQPRVVSDGDFAAGIDHVAACLEERSIGPASLALTAAIGAATPFSSATVVLFAPNSTTPVETINLHLVAVQEITTTDDGAATSTPQVQVDIEFGDFQYTLPNGQSASWNQMTNTSTF